jgi:prepilin-type processing-associated H-X9-DG protein
VSGIEGWITRKKLDGEFRKAPILTDMKQAHGTPGGRLSAGPVVNSWYYENGIPYSSHVTARSGEPEGGNFLFEDGHVRWQKSREIELGAWMPGSTWLFFYKVPLY